MIDTRLHTLLTLMEAGSYTKAARVLSLTQPAVSHHIRQLEQEYGAPVFYRSTKQLKLTPEGGILVKYARRMQALENNVIQSLEDYRNGLSRFTVGITPTAEENLVPRVMATYCNLHPDTSIRIVTDTIKNIYNMLKSYEVDIGIVEGSIPDENLTQVLLDTDYLCLIVSPQHPFARRGSVSLEELKGQRLILRSRQAGTRKLFENYLLSCSESLKSFHVIMEIDNVATIKELVASNLGVSVIAHSACIDAEHTGSLSVIPIENFRMTRSINMVHHRDFTHTEILAEIRQIYEQIR